MQEIRDRARANLPTVLLTLLSIVQALALEFFGPTSRKLRVCLYGLGQSSHDAARAS